MGLQAKITPSDLGLQLKLTQIVFGEEVSVDVDYQEALADAANTFMKVARDLVPVDTGYLRESIGFRIDGNCLTCYAKAEYAQYPEYGTWCQKEQPYFRPALQQAVDVLKTKGAEATSLAKQLLNETVNSMYSASMGAASEGFEMSFAATGNLEQALTAMSMEEFAFGLGIFAVAFIISFPLLVNLYAIFSSLGTDNTNGGYGDVESFISII